jgi:hypothetical protein
MPAAGCGTQSLLPSQDHHAALPLHMQAESELAALHCLPVHPHSPAAFDDSCSPSWAAHEFQN